MNYRSVATLNRDIVRWIEQLATKYDLIVGVPRSGLLVGNLLALHLNLPLTDVSGLIDGRYLAGGARCTSSDGETLSIPNSTRVLVVDDSVFSGRQLSLVRERLASVKLPYYINFGAVYVAPNQESSVDEYYEVVEMPRLFEWNILNHDFLKRACVDIDGVLCRDPREEENDDGDRYREFLENVPARVVPKFRIHKLVTCRLERYRNLTEVWLQRNGIEYDELVMWDLPDKAARLAAGSHGLYKAKVFAESAATLFIESSLEQALEIERQTGKYVFCVETSELVRPEVAEEHANKVRRNIKLLATNPILVISKVFNVLVRKWRRFND